MSMNFGVWLRKTRESAGMTMAELARRSGYTPQYISHLESGAGRASTQPSHAAVASLARGLNVPVAAAYVAAGYLPPTDEEARDEQRVLHYFRELSPEMQALALQIIKVMHVHASQEAIGIAVEPPRRAAVKKRRTA